MVTLTHGSLVVKNLEYVEETTYNTFPTNPAMSFAFQTAVIKVMRDESVKAFRRLGSEDPFKFLAGKEICKLTCDGAIANDTFLKYTANANVGTGTVNVSLSLGFSYTLNGTTNFRKISGARITECRLSGDTSTPELKLSFDLEAASISTPTSSDYIGAGSHATADSTAPFTFATGGSNPVTWNGSATDISAFNCSWKHGMATKFILGSRTAQYQLPLNRDASFDFKAPLEATTLEADMAASTARTLIWTITGGTTLTWTNAVLFKLSDETYDINAGDTIDSAFAGQSLTFAAT